MSLDMKIDPQYDEFLKSSKDQDRLIELLLDIQLICLNDGNFEGHKNIDELKNLNIILTDKINSKKIILDKAIEASKSIDERLEKISLVNMKDCAKCISALV